MEKTNLPVISTLAGKSSAEKRDESLLDIVEKIPVIETLKKENDNSKSNSKQVIHVVRENLENSLDSCSTSNEIVVGSFVVTPQQVSDANTTNQVVPPRPPDPGGKVPLL